MQPGFRNDQPTANVEVVAGFEAEKMTLENAAPAVDALASEGKAVDLAGEGAAVSAKVALKEPGAYAVLAVACGLEYGAHALTVSLGAQSGSTGCQAFTYYAPRSVFEVTEPGEYDVKVSWRTGRVRLDRVSVVRVVGAD